MDRTVGAAPDVAGRVAVVTGASRGLGAGMAQRFAEVGMRLGLCARTEPAPPASADGDRVVTAAVDVTDAAALDWFSAEVVDRFGRIDLWINNAGENRAGLIHEATYDELRSDVEINLLGAIFMTRRVLPAMLARGRGDVVFI
ncbi:MAG: SDR family oxidoreductase, partial [Acidimicrobiales bacterium]